MRFREHIQKFYAHYPSELGAYNAENLLVNAYLACFDLKDQTRIKEILLGEKQGLRFGEVLFFCTIFERVMELEEWQRREELLSDWSDVSFNDQQQSIIQNCVNDLLKLKKISFNGKKHRNIAKSQRSKRELAAKT